LGNVVDPGEIMGKYGPDTARHFILFAALPEKEFEWSDAGVHGSYRFLLKLWKYVDDNKARARFSQIDESKLSSRDRYIVSQVHKTVKVVTEYIASFRHSLALGQIMVLANDIMRHKEIEEHVLGNSLKNLALILSPFTPHLAEELWELLGQKEFVSAAEWPSYDESKIDRAAEQAEELAMQTRKDILSVIDLTGKKPKKISVIVAEEWKYRLFSLVKEQLEKTRDVSAIMKEAMSGELKMHGSDVAKIVPRLVADQSRLPKVVLSQEQELTSLQDADLSEFGSEVHIVAAEKSKEQKAKQAMPGKPAIVLE
jgi:leucyl-tRNA synthetase